MNDLQIFNYSENQVRTVLKGGQPYFVAKDICAILDITWNGLKTLAQIPGQWIGVESLTTPGGQQDLTIISESAVYKLAFRSNKEQADNFTNFVAGEIIPSIRKHGMYAKDELLDNPELLLDVIQKYKEERDKNRLLDTENKLLAQQTVKWADRKVIDALIKMYGAKVGFETAWREFKKELLYAHSINLQLRITNWRNETGRKTGPKVLDMIHDEEIPACVRTAVALCRNNKVDIESIVKKYQIA